MPCAIEYTDNRFVYAGRYYPDVPLLIDSHFQFVGPVCDYLRNLVTHERLMPSSVKTYAQNIQLFWNFLERNNLDYLRITDKELLWWFSDQDGRNNKDYVIQKRCDVVFDFYCWLEINGHVKNMVRIPGHNGNEIFEPMLSSKKKPPSRFRPSKYPIVSGVRPREKQSDAVQHTPTSEEVTKLYIAADNLRNVSISDRNHLLIDWYCQTGLRRLEVQNLTIDQVPSWDEIDLLRVESHSFNLRVVKTKGGRPRHVHVLASLLENTRDWIDGPRKEIVDRLKSKNNDYVAPNEIFISWKTGKALGLTSISNLFTSLFDMAKVDGHGHRLRGTALTNLLHAEIDAAVSIAVSHGHSPESINMTLIIHKVAEIAGHRNLTTIGKYVTYYLKKEYRSSGHDNLVTMKMILESGNQKIKLQEHRLAQLKEEFQKRQSS